MVCESHHSKKGRKSPLFHIPPWVRQCRGHRDAATAVRETIFHKERKQTNDSFGKEGAGGATCPAREHVQRRINVSDASTLAGYCPGLGSPERWRDGAFASEEERRGGPGSEQVRREAQRAAGGERLCRFTSKRNRARRHPTWLQGLRPEPRPQEVGIEPGL